MSLVLVSVFPVMAGEGDKYIGLQTGLLYPRIYNITLSAEMETSYHNAWEAYIDYQTQWNDCPACGKVCMRSFWKDRFSYNAGVAYKPAISRGKNSVWRARFGADLGVCNKKFALGVEIGLEYAYTTRSGIQLVFQQKNEVMFWGKPTWRNGALIGVRFPFFIH
jgi:hypothetical protein